MTDMKRIFVLFAAILLTFTACTQDGGVSSSESSAQSSSASSAAPDYINSSSPESSKESSASDGELLMKSFGELWMGDAYYIDVLLTQEYDSSKLGTSSSSEGNNSEVKTVSYDYIIAVDFENNTAGLVMQSDVGEQVSVIKDHELYLINPSEKTYTHELYEGEAEDFGEEFTVKRCLGIINNGTFVEDGETKYNDKDVKYEKYTLASQVPEIADPVITYYFDYAGKPVAEVVETETGKSTFDFRTVSQSIEAKSILEIPKGYTDATAS